jgi:hypothetical protein
MDPLTSLAFGPTARDNSGIFIRSMPQFLLRDGSRVTMESDPAAFDVCSYEKASGGVVHAVLSPQAEKAVLRSVDLDNLVGLTKTAPSLL